MPVSSDKEKGLLERMERLGIRKEDIEESFVRSSGPGGQHVNKTSTCVYVIHVPSGLSVKCGRTRSQALNRFYARRLLLDKIEKAMTGVVEEELNRIEKLKRQKRKRSKRAKEKMLQAKHRQSEKKSLRSKVPTPE
jgi:protein subunit release factor B